MKKTLSSRVYDCLPKSGSMTSTQISEALRQCGIRRDVRSITGILKHMKTRGQVAKIGRKAFDPAGVLNRWMRAAPVEILPHTKIVNSSFDSLLDATLLVRHWRAFSTRQSVPVYGDAR